MTRDFILSRRKLFSTTATAASAVMLNRLGWVNAYAQSGGDYRALVCIYLGGGNDGNNLLVPITVGGKDTYSQYKSIRGNVALPSTGAGSVVPIGATNKDVFGLHPALTDLANLYKTNELAVVANVGNLYGPLTKRDWQTNSPNRPPFLFSHSDQSQQWQKLAKAGSSGWCGRVADVVGYLNGGAKLPTAISMGTDALQNRGEQTPTIGITPGAPLQLDSSKDTALLTPSQELLQLGSGVTMVQALRSTFKDAVDTGNLITDALNNAAPITTQFPAKNNLTAPLQQVARLIQVRAALGMRRQIFFVSLGGFDHHQNVLPQQLNLFTQLNDAVTAFYRALGEIGVQDQVVTFTSSEFGRTFQPNGDNGSDHGWGSNHLVIGKPLAKADVYGKFPDITLGGDEDASNRGTYIPSTGVDQYGATFAKWFGVPDGSMNTVFPNLVNFPVKTLGLLG